MLTPNECEYECKYEYGRVPLSQVINLTTPETAMDRQELAKVLAVMLRNLPPREEIALRVRYWGDKTLRETGKYLGTSPERTRQILGRAIRRLRHPVRSKLLRPYNESRLW